MIHSIQIRTINLVKTKFLANPLKSIQIRNRKPVYIRKFHEPHYTKKEMLAACEPIYPRNITPDSERCPGRYDLTKPVYPIHPYDKLLAEDMKQELASSRMICFFHGNSITNREKIRIRNMFEHQNMFLRFYEPDCWKLAMTGTKYEPALGLHFEKDAILFSGETQVSKLFNCCKKAHQLVLIAAIIDDRFMSIDDLKNYSRLPDKQTLYAQLSVTLSQAAKSVHNLTNYPANRLVENLNMYIKDNKK